MASMRCHAATTPSTGPRESHVSRAGAATVSRTLSFDTGAGLVLEKLLKAEIILAAFPLHKIALRTTSLPIQMVSVLELAVGPAVREDQGLLWGEDRLVFRVSGALHGAGGSCRDYWSYCLARCLFDGSSANPPVILFFCVVKERLGYRVLGDVEAEAVSYAMEWGMVGIEEIEVSGRISWKASGDRYQLAGGWGGNQGLPPNIKARRNLIAWTVILAVSTAVMALVIGRSS